MQEIKSQILTGERALYKKNGIAVSDTVFCDGESPLKECNDVFVDNCAFKWRYPIWYCNGVRITDSVLFADARAGLWYCNDTEIKNSVIKAPKCIRRCFGLNVENVTMTDAQETLWDCSDIKLKNVQAHGEYFAMNSKNLDCQGLTLDGQYSFDGVKNVNIKNSKLITKDAFWNSENVTVSDSYIFSEYIGWNSKNLTFINCAIESLQGFCYIENLTLKNCKLINTTLAFEYSSVNAEIIGRVDSVFNPSGGYIKADEIGELTMDSSVVDVSKTVIDCDKILKKL